MPLERMWLRRPHARCSARDHRGLEAGSAVQGGGHDARRRADLDSGEAHKLRGNFPVVSLTVSTDRHFLQHQPEVILFGESIPQDSRSMMWRRQTGCLWLAQRSPPIPHSGAYLFCSSSSSILTRNPRLLKHAVELNKPVLLLNVGPSRGDDIEQIDRIDMASGLIIRDVVRAVLGTTASEDPVIAKMLESGIVKPPEDDTRPAEVVLSK
ncbi:hypothetical protein DFH06DRAFT_1416127 [Mycena polygramma]|nr:hypothetical protein DFH06DRAFT_1416127 [Mycena polygramma]